MDIGEQVARMVARREPRPANPDGGLGDLTPAEEARWTDLLNAPGDLCECGKCGCGSPILEPKRFRNG